MLTELFIVFVLLVFNGIFSAAEIAILSLRKTRLAEMVEKKESGAKAVQWLRAQPERFLATVQIGITVVGTTAAAFGGDRLAEHFSEWMAHRFPSLGSVAPRLSLVLVIVLVSFLEIVIGELVPKSLALRYSDRLSVLLGPMLRTMATVVKPLVWVFTWASNAVLRLFGDRTSFSEARLSPEELQELVEEAGRVGSIDVQSSEIASRAIEFRELTAFDVMVPREAIVAIPKTAQREQLAQLLAGRRYSRVVVYEGSRENVVGYVALKDLLVSALRGEASIEGSVRPVRFFPPGVQASNLLRQMQAERLPLVIVVDELGGLLGLVTIEDLLEELVGDIGSEGDPAVPKFAPESDGSYLVPGVTPIRDLNRALDLELPEPDSVSTIAGLLIETAGRLPQKGDKVTLPEGHVLEVVDASPRKVRVVRVFPAPTKPEDTSETESEE